MYKFTNAYRASDRTSQYLIRNVIYAGDQEPDEVVFRTLLFKLFNRTQTWEQLERCIGPVRWATYSFEQYNTMLARAFEQGSIYSAAYVIPPPPGYEHARKHSNHLRLLEAMMRSGLPARVVGAGTLEGIYDALHSFPGIGDFLAYQLAIDLNYSPLVDHSEMQFVVPGPGARDGIRKCFDNVGGWQLADVIRAVTDSQVEEFERRGIRFRSLWGRSLQLIDVQNLFCEISKYARVAHPAVPGLSRRTRIKQRFVPAAEPIAYWYPPKWRLNDRIAREEP